MSDSDPVNLSMGAARRVINAARAVERMPRNERGRPLKYPIPEDGSGGGCDAQNCIMQFTMIGKPTGGTWTIVLTVGGSAETITFNYNDSAASFKTALATHTEIASSDITVTGGSLPNATMQVEFIATLANTDISLPTAAWGSLTGGSGVAVISSLSQRGFA